MEGLPQERKGIWNGVGDLQPTEAMELAKSKSSDMGGVENHLPSLNSIELSVIGLLGRTLTGLGLCAH